MKRAKVLRLIEQVRAETRLEGGAVTFDQLAVCWSKRTVTFRGRIVEAGEQDCIIFPLLSTDRLVITRDGSDVA